MRLETSKSVSVCAGKTKYCTGKDLSYWSCGKSRSFFTNTEIFFCFDKQARFSWDQWQSHPSHLYAVFPGMYDVIYERAPYLLYGSSPTRPTMSDFDLKIRFRAVWPSHVVFRGRQEICYPFVGKKQILISFIAKQVKLNCLTQIQSNTVITNSQRPCNLFVTAVTLL